MLPDSPVSVQLLVVALYHPLCECGIASTWPNLEAAACVHGASTLRALRYVVVPLVFPSLLAAMLLVFAVAVRELVTSLLLIQAGVQTKAIFIWQQFE
ncbi:MAG: ABC transporter permease subunit [Symbiopectobacterium sp.]